MGGSIRHLLLGTLRRQLYFGVAGVLAVMMALFVRDLTDRQRALLLERQTEQAKALAQGVATSSAVWLVARDTAGLQEIVEAQRRYPELQFAMVLDLQGRVLAHTDRTRIGQYVRDLPPDPGLHVFGQSATLVDVATTALLADRPVGWARVGIDQGTARIAMAQITRDGALYTMLAIVIGLFLAWLMARRLTRGLHAIQVTIDAMKAGDTARRVTVAGSDEVSRLAGEFNTMLDTLVARDSELSRSEADLRLAAIAFDAQEGIVITDANQVILRVNQAFSRITGYGAEEAVGQTPRLLKSDRQDAEYYKAMWESLSRDRHWQGEIWNRRKDEQIVPCWLNITAVSDEAGRITHYVASHTDITQQKQAEETIHNLAFYDPLTQLPNRRLLHDRLLQTLAASDRDRHHGAILFIDLDNFKELNDTRGHGIGDLLLVDVAMRIKHCVRANDTVARLGGDEFVVLLDHLSVEAGPAAVQAETVAEKIRIVTSQPFRLQDHEYEGSASVGISLFLGRDLTEDELLKRADTAMYQAKRSGRNAVRFYDPATHAAMETRVALEADLRRALPDKQLRLYYQAQVDHAGRILSAEVLLRWQHPARGLVSPLDFIPLAEDTGLILPIGHWVLETACAQLNAWASRPGAQHLQLAVNVSARQFRQADFVAQVRAVLEKTAINPGRIKLELTESMVLDDVDDTIVKMQALRDIGVTFSMDDFGTGYSSLAYLSRLPLDQVKIDQSFVRNIGIKPTDAVIVQTIIGMASNLGLNVIAEGVETEEQRAFLEDHGCPACQGYLFGKPMPVEEFENMLPKTVIPIS